MLRARGIQGIEFAWLFDTGVTFTYGFLIGPLCDGRYRIHLTEKYGWGDRFPLISVLTGHKDRFSADTLMHVGSGAGPYLAL